MRTRFKSLLALGLTFAAGCFVGIVIGSSNPRWFKSFRQPPGPDRAVEHLTEVLELTPEQSLSAFTLNSSRSPNGQKLSEGHLSSSISMKWPRCSTNARRPWPKSFWKSSCRGKCRLRPKRVRRTSALPLRFKKTLIASVPPGDKTGFPFRECRTVD